jgi:RNA polymerase subunit RPABC4/transcription elongation factor Spt4
MTNDIISGYTGMMLTVDSEQSTVNSELEFTIPMLRDLI